MPNIWFLQLNSNSMRNITRYIQICILVIGGGGRKYEAFPPSIRACAKKTVEDAASWLNACTCASHV